MFKGQHSTLGGFAPMSGQTGWYSIPQTWVRDLDGSPSVVWGGAHSRPMIHLSQLPLLVAAHPEVKIEIDRVNTLGVSEKLRAEVDRSLGVVRLRCYQHTGREFIRSRRGSLVADQMRLGKTVMAASAHDPAAGPLVVIGPLAVRKVWLDWFKRLWPDEPVFVITGKTYDRSKLPDHARLIFIHYDVVPHWISVIRLKPATLIVDEAHALANRTSGRTRAVCMIATSADRVIALTGTPLWNRPVGLFPVLSLVTQGAFGGWVDFASRYCDGKPGSHGYEADGISHEQELRDRLSMIMIRRTWADVQADMPTVSRLVEVVSVSDEARRRMELLAEAVRQAHSTEIGDLARLRRLVGNIKASAAAELAAKLVQAGEPVVVWTWHRGVAVKIGKQLEAGGVPALLVTGDLAQDYRDKLLTQWTHTPAALIITMGVGQAGIDLSHARHAIFAEVDFTPAVVGQAEFRTYSPLRDMTVTYLCADHPIDRKLISILIEKCHMGQLIGTPAAESAVDVIREALDFDTVGSVPDLDRLRQATLVGAGDNT